MTTKKGKPPFSTDNTIEALKDGFMEKETEWEEIDKLVFAYQKSFEPDCSTSDKIKADEAAKKLLDSFFPFFYKYISAITTGTIAWDNAEQRLFVAHFMDSRELRNKLYSKAYINKESKNMISQRFNFVKETYGHYDEENIMIDLYMLFFVLAKRYKKKNRSFCCYLYNAYHYEVFRHIQSLLKNPLNIHYRNTSYDNSVVSYDTELKNVSYECDIDELITTKDTGMPNITWLTGQNCSEDFAALTPLERKIIAKYYIEQKPDKVISRELGIHVNTCNNRRHKAINKIAQARGINPDSIKRCRNSTMNR